MIPQSFKDIISNGEYSGLFQTIAMIIFLLIFFGLVWYVFSKPKKYYEEEQNAPLDNKEEDSELQL